MHDWSVVWIWYIAESAASDVVALSVHIYLFLEKNSLQKKTYGPLKFYRKKLTEVLIAMI